MSQLLPRVAEHSQHLHWEVQPQTLGGAVGLICMPTKVGIYIYMYIIYIYGKCLGFARTRNDDRRRIIIIIITIIIITIIIIIRIKPLLKIFNECRSLTGVGELNPYWRSSMNVKLNGGGRIKPLLRIFNECRSLTGVGELNPYWRSSMNVDI